MSIQMCVCPHEEGDYHYIHMYTCMHRYQTSIEQSRQRSIQITVHQSVVWRVATGFPTLLIWAALHMAHEPKADCLHTCHMPEKHMLLS